MCVDIIRVAPTLVRMMVFWQETPVRTSVGVRSTGGFCGYWPLVLRTPTIIRGSLFRWQCLFRTTVGATLVSLRTSVRRSHFFNLPASVGRNSVGVVFHGSPRLWPGRIAEVNLKQPRLASNAPRINSQLIHVAFRQRELAGKEVKKHHRRPSRGGGKLLVFPLSCYMESTYGNKSELEYRPRHRACN